MSSPSLGGWTLSTVSAPNMAVTKTTQSGKDYYWLMMSSNTDSLEVKTNNKKMKLEQGHNI